MTRGSGSEGSSEGDGEESGTGHWFFAIEGDRHPGYPAHQESAES